jgi:hypothetical protein
MLKPTSFVDNAKPKQIPVPNSVDIEGLFCSIQYFKNMYNDKTMNKRHNEFIMATRAWVNEMPSNVKKNTANNALSLSLKILFVRAYTTMMANNPAIKETMRQTTMLWPNIAKKGQVNNPQKSG